MISHLQKPAVVLVHGAWADGSSWNKVAYLLQAHEFNVVSAQLPLSSFSDDVATLSHLLYRQVGPVVLVGHSYGGAVITAAAAGNAQVQALVYVAAIVPDQGETVGEIFGRAARDPKAPILRPDEAGLLWMTSDAFRSAIAPDASPNEIAMMAVAQKPIAIGCLSEPLAKASWREKPSWFLLAEKDVMISPETQRYTAERMQAKLLSLPVDHSPMYSHPHAVVDFICDAALTLQSGFDDGHGTVRGGREVLPAGRIQ